MKITFLKKVIYRIVKQIQLVSLNNIYLQKSTQLCRNSIINAKKGTIILGENTRIGNSTELVAEANKKIIIKDYSTLYSNCKILGDVEIERYCTIATNIYMSSGNHYAFHQPELLVKIQDKIVLSDEKGRNEHNKKIHIHEDVWIGNGVFISRGITVGRGAIIGANSVVTKDVEPYSVVVGIPARKSKSRFNYIPPSRLDCQKIETYPYFYQGFNHYLLPTEIEKNGFQLIDEGIIHLTKNSSNITFSGTSTQNVSLIILADSIEFKEQLKIGDFNFSIKIPINDSTSHLTIKISSNVKKSVYLKQVIGN